VIEKDRVLLARLSRVNQSLGQVVLELCDYQDGGGLPPVELRTLGTLLADWTKELDHPIVDADGCGRGFFNVDSSETGDQL